MNNIAKSAVVSGTATPGAKVSIGSQEVEADKTSGTWSITVPGLSVGANELTVIQKIGGTEHDRKTVTATIVEGGTVVPEPTDGVTLPRGETTTVPVTVKTTETRTGIDGQIVFEAPEGTTFAAAEDREVQYKLPTEDTWRTSAWLGATDGVLSDDDTTLTYDTVTTDSRFNLPAGSLVRFTADVATPEDARGGSSSVGYVFSGQSPQGDFKAEGQTNTTIETAAMDLQAEVSKVNNIAKTAVVTGTATPGATVSIGEESVQADETTGEWSITVPALVAGPNELTVVQTIGGTKHDETKVTATIVEGGTLVGVDQGPVTLERGETTQVPFVVENREFRAGTTGSVTIDAPEGTTFNGQTTVQGSWRNVGATNWSGSSSIPLTNGRLSNDDKTLTFDVNWTSERPVNQQYRYLINVTADAEADAGTSAMNFDMPGTSSKGDFRAKGSTSTTIETADRELAPITLTGPASVTPGVSNTFTGTAEPGATFRVLNASGTQIVPGTHEVDENGNWTFNRVVSNGASNFRFVIEQTKNGQVVTSELFTVNAATLAPVTVTGPAAVRPGVSNTFTGTAEPGATYRVLNASGTQIVPGTHEIDDDGNWTFNRVVSNGASNFRFVIEQTKNGQFVKSDLFTINATALTPVTVETPERVTPGRSNTFTGAGEPNATFRVLNISGTQIVPGTHSIGADGKWTFDRVVSNGASNFRFVIEQTKNGQVEKSELFTIDAADFAPVTVSTRSVTPGVVNTFTGTGEPNASFRVLNITGTQIVPGTFEVDAQGNWTFERAVSRGATEFRFALEQTKNGKVELSELFTLPADTK